MFHAAALYMTLIMIHYWDIPAAFGIGERPLSADMVMECLKYADVDSVVLPPAIVEELSQSEENVEVLNKLSYVAFGGGKSRLGRGTWASPMLTQVFGTGNLAGEAGDRLISNGVTLLNIISATE